ncbi:MAG: hypothetical protein WC264_03330 [Candidatus Paceibacterota bacterium]|jgi:hypothetical protein
MQHFKKKLMITTGTLLFAFSIFSFFFIYHFINKKNKIAENTFLMWQEKYQKREEIKLLNNSIKDIEADKVLLDAHFAQSTDVVPFLNTIESLATKVKAKAEVTSVDILKDKTGLLVGIKTLGSFEAVYKFLMLLENSPYELEINSVDMQTLIIEDSSKKLKIPEWNASFKIKLLTFIQ